MSNWFNAEMPIAGSSSMNFKLTGYGVKKNIAIFAYKQLGLSMDIETKVFQHVSSPKESNLTT